MLNNLYHLYERDFVIAHNDKRHKMDMPHFFAVKSKNEQNQIY